MSEKRVFNPLDKKSLGLSVADALLSEAVEPLGNLQPFRGAGIYAIYYRDGFSAYAPLAECNRREFVAPIYVGKAVPAGARKGRIDTEIDRSQMMFRRLREHAESIRQVEDYAVRQGELEKIRIGEFFCRYLLVDDIWIPLGESVLIDQFKPIWNKIIDGFGNHDPGGGRYNQQRSAWDTLHPGRPWAAKCRPFSKSPQEILETLKAFFQARG